MDAGIEALVLEHMLLTRHSSALGRQRSGSGLERSAYILLSRLEVDGPLTTAELADVFLLDTSTVHRQMTALLKGGLVERFADSTGRLVRRFRMTDEGERALVAHRAHLQELFADLVADWDSADVTSFVAHLRRFNSEIEARQERPWPR
ncbi:MarR family winged helix-turn-helix transcriptional regulator [Nocardioides yefusunii]|uniref:MarR family winged helix-turn-helix transcriptional regulator n=1 Tax=Nocardioides yefusunii TaxID=2500546 RepID=A0ABW1QTB8_9ACTN|nr:MarR family transcriptional regulator [Nocardioides yefusunii]